MVQASFRLIPDSRRNPPALEDRSIKRRFCEIRGLEALEKQHKRRARLQAKRTLRRKDAPKIALERVEKWERFGGFYKIIVSAEADCVLVEILRDIVHQLKPRFSVKIRVASVDSCRERIGDLEVRLRTHRGKIK